MSPSTALLLLLLDSRAPAGGHNHSAGMEPAVETGLVRDLADVESLCRARLRTAGRVAAAFAAAACDLWLLAPRAQVIKSAKWSRSDQNALLITGGEEAWPDGDWHALDAEFDARTPSPAMRAASRQLGNGLRRLVRTMLPGFDPPWQALRPAPHHPIVLGAAVAAAGGTRDLAGRAAALAAVSAPASAAVRLLGLDPLATQAMLARLAVEIDATPVPTGLPADGAPALDLLADYHLTAEVRLFAS